MASLFSPAPTPTLSRAFPTILLLEVIPIVPLSYNMRTSRNITKQPMHASSCWRNSQKLEQAGEEQGRVQIALQPRTPLSWGSELFWPIAINAPMRRGGFNVISSLDDSPPNSPSCLPFIHGLNCCQISSCAGPAHYSVPGYRMEYPPARVVHQAVPVGWAAPSYGVQAFPAFAAWCRSHFSFSSTLELSHRCSYINYKRHGTSAGRNRFTSNEPREGVPSRERL